jgi:hypothetical protein
MANIVDVTVEYDPQRRQVRISSDPVVLDDSIGYVIWTFAGLPTNAEPRIRFKGSRTGPFFHLTRSGSTIVGAGNRGPARSAAGNAYEYEVVLEAKKEGHAAGAGTVQNLALTSQELPPLPGSTANPGDPPPEDPPRPKQT